MKNKHLAVICTVLFLCHNTDMYEHQKILNRIEKLIEQIPYKWVKIEIELEKQTLVLEKEHCRTIGFQPEKELR